MKGEIFKTDAEIGRTRPPMTSCSGNGNSHISSKSIGDNNHIALIDSPCSQINTACTSCPVAKTLAQQAETIAKLVETIAALTRALKKSAD